MTTEYMTNEFMRALNPISVGKYKNEYTVKEIHDSFYNASEEDLKSKELSSKDLDKIIKLKDIGFSKSMLVRALKESDHKTEYIAKALDYFSQKYPLYKYITHEKVKYLCKKYGFILGDIDNFIGDVPDENIDHILNFRIDDKDRIYVSGPFEMCLEEANNMSNISAEHEKERPADIINTLLDIYRNPIKKPFMIVAPQELFDAEDKEIIDHELVDKDPIVLMPVMFENRKGYLIVTAWGPEASDEEVINGKMN